MLPCGEEGPAISKNIVEEKGINEKEKEGHKKLMDGEGCSERTTFCGFGPLVIMAFLSLSDGAALFHSSH